jgi:phenylacetic acid degradation operon negative regulatory protein
VQSVSGDSTAPGEHDSTSDLSARNLLSLILGDYWLGCAEPVPSAALVAVLADFGVTQANARAALGRLARSGDLVRSKDGRCTSYRPVCDTARQPYYPGRRLMRFGLEVPPWDGRWTCVAFALPDDVNRSGPTLRRGLRRLGLAQLYDGLWVTPTDPTAELNQLLARVGVDRSTVFRSEVAELESTGIHPLAAWDLDALRHRFARLIAELDEVSTRLTRGEVSPREGLRQRTALTVTWWRLAEDDPRLPAALLGPDWPLGPARDRFVDVYDGLGPLAQARARQVVARYDLPEHTMPRHHRVADLLTQHAG